MVRIVWLERGHECWGELRAYPVGTSDRYSHPVLSPPVFSYWTMSDIANPTGDSICRKSQLIILAAGS